MWKKRLGYTVLFCLFCLSITLMLSGKLKDIILKDRSIQLRVTNYTADEIAENMERQTGFQIEEVTSPGIKEITAGLAAVRPDDVIGGLLIPDIDLNLAIFQGVTKENLVTGAGTLKEGQQMGAGNYALAGHHMKDTSLLFGPLLEIEPGSLIYVTDLDYVYVYKAAVKEIIHENDIQVLEDTEEAMITLITCDRAGYRTSNRLIVQGNLLQQIPAAGTESKTYTQDYLKFIEKTEKQLNCEIIFWLIGILMFAAVLTKLIHSYIKR